MIDKIGVNVKKKNKGTREIFVWLDFNLKIYLVAFLKKPKHQNAAK